MKAIAQNKHSSVDGVRSNHPRVPMSIPPDIAHSVRESETLEVVLRPATRDPLPGHPRAQDLSSSEDRVGRPRRSFSVAVSPSVIPVQRARLTMTAGVATA